MIQIAKEAGYTLIEKNISIGETITADEIFLTGTAAELVPVRELAQRTIGCGVAGPITRDLQARFTRAATGEDPKYIAWVEPIA